jgi:hypothetical protein
MPIEKPINPFKLYVQGAMQKQSEQTFKPKETGDDVSFFRNLAIRSSQLA